MIVKMKKLSLFAMLSDREALLHELMLLGCVEVIPQSEKLLDPSLSESLSRVNAPEQDYRNLHSKATAALGILNRYAPAKSSIFAPRREVGAEELFSDELVCRTKKVILRIEEHQNRIATLQAEASRLEALKLSLEPWKSNKMTLNFLGTENVRVMAGTTLPSVTAEVLREELAKVAEEFEVFPINSDREQNYIIVIFHKAVESEVMSVLRNLSFSRVVFGSLKGTAEENIEEIEAQLASIKREISEETEKIKELSSHRADIELCIDSLAQEISKIDAAQKLLGTESVFYLEGWVTAPDEKRVTDLLLKYTCAFEFADPAPEDYPDVPIKLKNNRLTEPLTMVTEMYSLPAYEGIDPNPLIMPFFSVFFGIMYGDMGYGIVLLILGILAKTKLKPRGVLNYMTGLLIICGVTTILAGAAFGSFFGNAIPIVTEMLGLGEKDPLLALRLIDPMTDPLKLLVGSLIIGAIQIIVGMAIKAYMLIRDGKPLDALFDVGSWWLLFAGIAVGALKGVWWVAIAGVAALVLTQGRNKPTIPGKIIGGIASLYDITGYFGDILSYARLMALVLATSVIGSVINLLGSLTGNIILFAVIFIAGHGFSMAINIIGTYVHSARLQYLEYFGKFYIDGGKAFRPLKVDTKYVEVK